MAKNLFSPLLKATLYNLLLVTLVVAIWVSLYISGCSLLSNLPSGSVATVLYILLLWLILPILFILLYWQSFLKHHGGKVKPHHYGLFLCTSFVLWSLLSIIMGLGPCYRYHITGSNSFGETLFAVITLPLLLFEAGNRATSLSSPLFALIVLMIVYSLGLLFGYLKSVVAGNTNEYG